MTSKRPGSPRLSLPVVALCALAAGGGCAEFENNTDAAPPEPERRTELSHELHPPEPVGTDPLLGTSITSLLEEHTQGSTSSVGQMGPSCEVSHYDVDGSTVAVDEHCLEAHRRVFFYVNEAAGSPPTLWRVVGDLDDDDRVDGWFDPSRGELLEDDDRDGLPDRLTVGGDHVDPELVATFDEDWEPPAEIESRVLEDTDFDGFYDLETIVAGVDDEGNQTHWVAR